MKKLAFLLTVLFTVITIGILSSCENQEQEEIQIASETSESNLAKYGNIHNQGLDYLKVNLKQSAVSFTAEHLDSVFQEYVRFQSGEKEGEKILTEIHSMKQQVLNGIFPSIEQVRSDKVSTFADNSNPYAGAALNEALIKIKDYLQSVPEDQIIDNQQVIADMQELIYTVNNSYDNQGLTSEDKDAIEQTLGVLYGSVAYWSTSENIQFWSACENNNNETHTRAETGKTKKLDTTSKNTKQKLSVVEFLSVMAAADAIGTMLGPEAGVIASTAAALAYDVE